MNDTSIQHTITARLKEALDPVSLEVIDESHLHAGHAGARPGGQSHFRIKVVSAAFDGKSRVERHRMVNRVLGAELAGPVHALAIRALTPAEAGVSAAVDPSRPAAENGFALIPLDATDGRLVSLLEAAGLPTADLAGDNKAYFGLRGPDGNLAAAAGLEVHGTSAVLRSCAVATDRRGEGLGRRLVGLMLSEARHAGADRLYLLTETAEAFFAGLGFRPVDRADIPPEVAGSSLFAGVCPQGAKAMVFDL